MSNHLESLIAEWYELQGYLVSRNIKVGIRKAGGYDGELDIVAFNPFIGKLVHIETSLDADKKEVRVKRINRKFEIGRKHIPELFKGIEQPEKIEQKFVLAYGSAKTLQPLISEGEVIHVKEVVREIFEYIQKRHNGFETNLIHENLPLLRTVQLFNSMLKLKL